MTKQEITSTISNNKGMRLLFSFGLLFISAIVCFLFIKSTIDWATFAKTELNRMKDSEYNDVVDKINLKFNYIKRMDQIEK
jgi:hypothetical protein